MDAAANGSAAPCKDDLVLKQATYHRLQGMLWRFAVAAVRVNLYAAPLCSWAKPFSKLILMLGSNLESCHPIHSINNMTAYQPNQLLL